jgi:hypothetical protein
MAVHAIESAVPATALHPARRLLFRVRVRLAAARLDARLAAGEDHSSDVALAHRATRIASPQARARVGRGIERACSERPQVPGFSAAIPVDGAAVTLARPALEQLAAALRTRRSVTPRGVALAQALLTEPGSALYRPSRPEELHEVAREALLALGPDRAAGEEPR